MNDDDLNREQAELLLPPTFGFLIATIIFLLI